MPIDMIGGASAGAIIAAQFAQGWSVAELYARNRRLAHLGRSLIDYTVPLVSLIQARKFMLMLHELFGQTCIEDLWLPFWCLSSNLTRAEKSCIGRPVRRRHCEPRARCQGSCRRC